MVGIIYALIASICIGFHIFSIKYIQQLKDKTLFIFILIGSFCLFLISRVFIYLSSIYIPISYVHVLLNLSILVTTLLSIYIYQLKVNLPQFLSGFILIVIGLLIIRKSYL